MKEFEKWKAEYCSRRCCSGTSSCRGCNKQHKEAWKAVLEWVNNKAVELNFSKVGLDICTLQDVLSKEIEDE